jgi:hypothetical protein
MTNLQKGIQREIALFSDAIASDGGSIPEVTKAAFCKARMKLKPAVFSALSDIVVQEFYNSNEGIKRHGFRIIGVDGCVAELPNSPDIKANFGVWNKTKDGKDICMARMLTLYDTLNHITLKGSLESVSESEIEMLWKCLPDIELNSNDLLVFDRYYASHILFFYLQKRGVQFCFRMKSNWWKVVESFNNGGKESDVITLELPAKDKIKATEYGITETKLRCRLTRIELDGGEIEILLTSLVNQEIFSVADTKEIYGLRWPIEDSYKTFKHKVCIENFSGKSKHAILQDFYVKIFIMNLTAVAVRPINEALKKEPVKVKYTHQVNLIEAIATMKKAVVSFFVTNKISKAIRKLYDRISTITEPIRPGRKIKRHKRHKRKYYMNYKPV